MSQNTGEKQITYFLKPIWKLLLQCCLQHPSCHRKTPTAPLSHGPRRHCIFGAGAFELEAMIVLTWLLKEVYTVSHSDPVRKVALTFSKFQWHLRAGSYLWWQHQTKKFPRPAARSGLHPHLGCVATTLRSGSQSWCSRKKIFHLCQVIFQEEQMPQPAHNMALWTAVSPVGKVSGRSSQDEVAGGKCLGSWHCVKTNLGLWVDQPLATLPPQLYSSPLWSLRWCHDPQHILASQVKKQSNFSAM